MMKSVRFMSLLAIVVSMLIACQQELTDATQPSKSTTHSSLREADNCDCVEDYADSQVTFTSESDPEITVEVWNDATTVYYHLRRTDNGNIGNLFIDGSDEAEGGSNLNFYNFTKPVGELEACGEQTTALRVVGASGSPIEFSITYKIVELCSTPVCIAYQYETGMGGPTAGAGRAWWYYYPAGSGVQTIYAGQTIPVGTVEIDADGDFTITLADGWELKEGTTESVKIQGYDAAPSSRPAAGLFSGPSSYKGTSLTGSIAPKAVYVVHLDLQKCTAWGEGE